MRPTCIISPPFVIKNPATGKNTVMLNTDAGVMSLKAAALTIPEEGGRRVTKSAMYSRVFTTEDSWQEDDIFELKRKSRERGRGGIGNVRAVATEPQVPVTRPGQVFITRLGSWERKDRVWSMFKREQTIKHLPSRDREYNDALKFNRAVCR